MKDEKDRIRIHFILEKEIVANFESFYIPLIGDYLNLSIWDSSFEHYQVKKREWVYAVGELLKINITIKVV